MGKAREADGARAQVEAAPEKKEEDMRAAKWVLGLLCSGAAWLLGKASEWLFGPSEPQTWWVWTKRLYFGAVYVVAAVQLAVVLYQLFVLLREERKTRHAEPLAGQKPNEEWPKDFKGWVRHIALVLVCWLLLAAFIALCVAYGYVIETIKEWWSSLFS
jgi:hypothetical protein